MKTRMNWPVAIALLPALGIVSVCSAPAHADHGGSNATAQSRVRISLTGAAIARVTPEGHAEFRSAGAQRQLNVEVEKVNLADGTVLTVNVNGSTVSTLTLKLWRGAAEINTSNGASVPVIHKGDVVTVVKADGTVIERGSF